METKKHLEQQVQNYLEQNYDLSNSTMPKKVRQEGSDKSTEQWQNALIKIVYEQIAKPYQDFSDSEKWVAAQEAMQTVITEMKKRLKDR
jgi:hypothetical protein